jgi:hypothetical protein
MLNPTHHCAGPGRASRDKIDGEPWFDAIAAVLRLDVGRGAVGSPMWIQSVALRPSQRGCHQQSCHLAVALLDETLALSG